MPAHHGKYVTYYRVSTDRQGKSGLEVEVGWQKAIDKIAEHASLTFTGSQTSREVRGGSIP